MITKLSDQKYLVDDASASKLIVGTKLVAPYTAEAYVEYWDLRDMFLRVRFALRDARRHLLTGATDDPAETWRWFGIVSGVALGGYVGVSHGPDGYHIGTPGGMSKKLLATLARLAETHDHTTTVNTEVLRVREGVLARERRLIEEHEAWLLKKSQQRDDGI